MFEIKPPFLGVAYYPEDWDVSEIDKDIAKMLDIGINVARIGEFAWRKMEPKDGEFDFSWLHSVVEKLKSAGIGVVMGTPTVVPPIWLTKKYPDMLAENMPVSDVQEKLCSYGKAVNAKIIFKFNIKELSFDTCELMVETPEIFDISVNGNNVPKNITGYCHDVCFKTIDIYKYLKNGENEICLSCVFEQKEDTYKMLNDIKYFESIKNSLTYDMEIEAVYLKGDFGVFSNTEFEFIERNAVKTKGDFYISKAPETITDGPIEIQGYPFFAGSLTLSKKIILSSEEAKNTIISFEKLPSIVTDIFVNGKRAGKIMWKPYNIDISDFVHEGENEISITLTGSLRNLLGPFHLKEGETHTALPFYFFHKTDVWGWGDGFNPKWTNDYSFVQNGIFLGDDL